MLFTIALILNFSEQFHVINNTIFHTKYMILLFNEISFKYVKFLASETCDNGISHAKDFEISSLWNFSKDAKFSRNQPLLRIVLYILRNIFLVFHQNPYSNNVLPAVIRESRHPSYYRGSKNTAPDGSCAINAIAQDCFDKVLGQKGTKKNL